MASGCKVCNELVGTGDVDRDAGACLGAGNRGNGAVGKALGLKGAVDGLVHGGWCGRRVAEGPRLFGGDGPLEGLGRGLVGVRGCRRGGVGQPSGGGVGVGAIVDVRKGWLGSRGRSARGTARARGGDSAGWQGVQCRQRDMLYYAYMHMQAYSLLWYAKRILMKAIFLLNKQ